MLLLLRPLDGTEHTYVEASQQRCVHDCKGTISSFVAFEVKNLFFSTPRMVCRSSSAPAVFRASSILPMARIPKVVLRFLRLCAATLW